MAAYVCSSHDVLGDANTDAFLIDGEACTLFDQLCEVPIPAVHEALRAWIGRMMLLEMCYQNVHLPLELQQGEAAARACRAVCRDSKDDNNQNEHEPEDNIYHLRYAMTKILERLSIMANDLSSQYAKWESYAKEMDSDKQVTKEDLKDLRFSLGKALTEEEFKKQREKSGATVVARKLQ